MRKQRRYSRPAAALCLACAVLSGWGQSTAARCEPAGTPASAGVTRFRPTYACLLLGDQQTVVSTDADTLAAIEVSGSFKENAGAGRVTVGLASYGASSDDLSAGTAARKLYIDGDSVFPIHTALIQLKDGVPTYVTFDEGCFFCDAGSAACLSNWAPVPGAAASAVPVGADTMRSCAVKKADCADTPTASNPSANSCDLKLFVAWTGTDAAGAYMTSAGQRFSRFRSFPLGAETLWERLKTTAASGVNGLQPRP